MDKIDKRSMHTFLTSEDEAVEILVDMFNGHYKIEQFKNDVMAHFEPDDRDESWITFKDKDK